MMSVYQRLMLISAVVLLVVVDSSWALICEPCSDTVSCPVLQCKGGKIQNVCSCCPQCAKQKDEICGGLFDALGFCDKGLQCVRSGHPMNSAGVCKEEAPNNGQKQPRRMQKS